MVTPQSSTVLTTLVELPRVWAVAETLMLVPQKPVDSLKTMLPLRDEVTLILMTPDTHTTEAIVTPIGRTLLAMTGTTLLLLPPSLPTRTVNPEIPPLVVDGCLGRTLLVSA